MGRYLAEAPRVELAVGLPAPAESCNSEESRANTEKNHRPWLRNRS